MEWDISKNQPVRKSITTDDVDGLIRELDKPPHIVASAVRKWWDELESDEKLDESRIRDIVREEIFRERIESNKRAIDKELEDVRVGRVERAQASGDTAD